MSIANNIRKSIIIKEEVTWGVAPSAGGAQVLRRTSGTLQLAKEKFDSQEIRTDYQTVDSRHGTRSVTGTLNGELSPGSYSMLYAAMLCKDFVAGPTAATLGLTIATSGAQWSVTRASGSWLTDSFKIGHTVRLSVGTLNAANINKNLVVTAVTATVLTVVPLNGVALVAEGPISSCTVTCTGKQSYIPQTGHTQKSFTVEEFFSDVSLSHLFTGAKLSSANVTLPATGLVTATFGMTAKDLSATGTTQYFTAPTAQTTSGVFASVSGVLVINGAPVALVTSMNINTTKALTPMIAIASTTAADIVQGKIDVSGSCSVYFQDGTLRDLFNNETEFSLIVSLATSNSASADFMTFTMGRVKANSFTLQESDGMSAQIDFTALLNKNAGAGLAGELTTLTIQDSLAA